MAKAPTAKRYAQALFELASAQGTQEAWLEELSGIEVALADPTVTLYFAEPRVSAERKQEAVAQLTAGRDKLVANLIGLLVQRNAVSLVPGVVKAYGELLNQSLGRVQADVTSATAMSAEQQDRLRVSLSGMLDKQVIVAVQEDPAIIGGIVVRVGDQIIDGSVRTRLEALRLRLAHESLV